MMKPMQARVANTQAKVLNQYLTFALAGEDYGVDILAVREIRGWSRVTRIPQSPSFILGVLNLRGAIVPIMDLRARFNLPEQARDELTVTIIVAIAGRHFGMVVDAVSDVLDVDPEQVCAVPDFGPVVDTEYLSGLVPSGERMVLLLQVDKLLRTEEWQQLDKALTVLEHAVAVPEATN
ncbi:MAG: chemotaxis protein CheW [Lysobacterales bacterium CG_4_10_14_3_um_filter_64_11]|nr:MAG: chemotaxis protein CheW [Xanthomonadales bacterium CG_4_10_14_3_um_filter_64_11]